MDTSVMQQQAETPHWEKETMASPDKCGSRFAKLLAALPVTELHAPHCNSCRTGAGERK